MFPIVPLFPCPPKRAPARASNKSSTLRFSRCSASAEDIYLETHVSKISGAFPTYKKIRRKSTRMAQCRKHGAIPQKRRNEKFCTGKDGAITGKNGAIIGKNGAFQHQNLKPYLFPKERRMPEISAAIR